MIRFLDGPASGQVLSLKRVPTYLRVVRHVGTGKWDGLDQLCDSPQPQEQVHVYRLVSNDGVIHLDSYDRETGRRYGQTLPVATYALCATQPSDEVVRDDSLWPRWCQETARKEGLIQ